MTVVSDNSVLSCLAEIGELELLRRLYGGITVTETVRREAIHRHAPQALRALFADETNWITVVPDECPYLTETGVLDSGEASAITLAWRHRESSLLILDEKRGRKVPTALGLRITGTAGLLTDAAAAGLIGFENVFARLAKTQFHLNPQLVEELRQSLGVRLPPSDD